MIVCVDSSFLVSSYLSDLNSQESDRRRAGRHELLLSRLNRSEFAHAIYQNVFRGHMNAVDAHRLWSLFERDCEHGLWIESGVPDSVWNTSIELARRHGSSMGVRALDSLHVAFALELKAERFWTFDERQRRLAEAAGLDTRA